MAGLVPATHALRPRHILRAMAGLVPATHVLRRRQKKSRRCLKQTPKRPCVRLVPTFDALFNHAMTAFVYMMTNRRNGVLYAGVTTNMPRRAYEHREGLIDGFTKALRAQATGLLRSFR